MVITELDVVNACLSTLGEVPLNSVNTDHPYVSAVTRLLRQANARVQARGWWFNKETVTLRPDAETGEILLPPDFLSTDTATKFAGVSARGRRLYDKEKETFQFEEPRTVAIVRLLPFEHCPYTAQDATQHAVLMKFVESFDADQLRVQQVRSDYAAAMRALRYEHVRNMDLNVLEDGGVGQRRAYTRSPGMYSGRMRTR